MRTRDLRDRGPNSTCWSVERLGVRHPARNPAARGTEAVADRQDPGRIRPGLQVKIRERDKPESPTLHLRLRQYQSTVWRSFGSAETAEDLAYNVDTQ